MNDKLNSILCGVSGEYFVAAELSRRGAIASITLRNSKGVDILASDLEAKRTVAIQVKTFQGSKRTWVLSNKAESYYADNLFYVFVNLHGVDGRPDYFIVPSKVVAKTVKEDHLSWLNRPGKKGQAHKDSNMRNFSDPEGKFLGAWDKLGLGLI